MLAALGGGAGGVGAGSADLMAMLGGRANAGTARTNTGTTSTGTGSTGTAGLPTNAAAAAAGAAAATSLLNPMGPGRPFVPGTYCGMFCYFIQ